MIFITPNTNTPCTRTTIRERANQTRQPPFLPSFGRTLTPRILLAFHLTP